MVRDGPFRHWRRADPLDPLLGLQPLVRELAVEPAPEGPLRHRAALLAIRLERLAHFLGALVAIAGLSRQGFAHDGHQLLGQPRAELIDGLEAPRADLLQRLEEVHVRGEHPAAGQPLPEGDARAVDVRAVVDARRPGRLLRAHVADLALEHPDAGLGALDRALRDPEVDDLHRSVEADDEVVRGDVAMDETDVLAVFVLEGVGVGEARADLLRHVRGDLGRDAPPAAADEARDAAHVEAAEHLHGDVIGATFTAVLEAPNDVLVLEAGDELGLVDEHVDEVTAGGDLGEHPLDGDDPGEPGAPQRPGGVDLRHPAGGETLNEEKASKGGGGFFVFDAGAREHGGGPPPVSRAKGAPANRAESRRESSMIAM